MAADVQIRFKSNSQQAQRDIAQLQKEIAELRASLGQSERSAESAGKEMQQLGVQSRQTAASLDALEKQSNAVRRETLEYRTAISRLNAELADNRNALLKADGAAKETLETRNRQIRAEQGLLRAKQQSSALTLTALQQERRELGGLSGAFGKATGGASLLSRAGSELAGTLGAIGISELVFGLQRFTTSAARASIEIDSNTRALAVLTGSAAEAERAIQEIQDLADEPGLQFRQAVRGALALRSIGTEAETTTRILKEFANAAAFSGGQGEFERGLLGFRQLIQRSGDELRLTQEEINQVTENISLASRVLQEEFGTVIAEDIQAQLERAGQNIDDFVERVLTGFERLERFPLDAPSVKLKNLSNSFFEFQAAVGDRFLPILAAGAEGMTAFLDNLTEFISGVDEATASQERFNAAINEADTGTGQNDAIQQRVKDLEALILTIEVAASRSANLLSIKGRETETARELREYREELELLRLAADRTGEGTAKLNELLRSQETELANTRSEITRLSNQIEGKHVRLVGLQRAELANWREEEVRLNAEIGLTQKLIAASITPIQESTQATKEATETTHEFVSSIDALGGVLGRVDPRFLTFHERAAAFQSTIRELPSDLTAVRGDFDVLAPTAGRVAEVFKDLTVPLTDTTAEQNALAQSSRGLIHELNILERISSPFEVLREDINLVNPIISRAVDSINAYTAALDGGQFSTEELSEITSGSANRISAFADEVLTAEGVLNVFAKGIDEAKGKSITLQATSERLRDSIRDQASAFDALRASVGGVSAESNKLPGELLDISDALDSLDSGVRATRGELGLTTGILETLGDNAEFFGDIAVIAFDEASRAIRQSGEEIDTVGESLLSISDLAARIATGDLSAAFQLPFRVSEINQQNDEIARQRRASRRAEAIESQTLTGFRDQNLATVARALGIGIGRFDVSEAPHTAQGLLSLNDFSGTGLDILSRNLLSGQTDIDGGISAGIQQAIDSSTLSDDIKRSLLTLAGNLDRAITGADIEGIFQQRIGALRENLNQSKFNLTLDQQLGRDLTESLNTLIRDTTALYDEQSAAIALYRRSTGHLSFGDLEGLAQRSQSETNRLRLLIGAGQGPQNAQQFISQNNIIRGLDAPQDAQEAGVVFDAAQADTGVDAEVAAAEVAPEALASVIESINEDVALINASITAVETQIEQASEPAEIAELLSQIPDLIREKYRQLREALDARYSEGEISVDVYNASLSELQSNESRDLDQQSDAVLSNTIQAINEDVALINASVVALQTAIDGLSEPAAIAELLLQVPALIREKYQQLRESLDARYAEGEISTDIYNASLSELASSETSELEQHSDAVLANTIRGINEDVQLIDASITALQTQINGLSDPEAIAELLTQLPALIQEKYQTLRTALDTRYAAGEISTDIYNASLSELASSESRDLEQQSDAVLANTLQEIDEDAQLVNASITSIETQINQTSDPSAIASLLNQLPALITEKYRLLREALDEKYAAGEISVDVYNSSISVINSREAGEIERNSDAVLANTLSEIDDDVDLIDANIGALQLAVENADDPEAVAGLLDAIKILVMDKYKRLRERLDELLAAEEISQTAFDAATTALGTAERRALAGIDTQGLNAISESAQEQVDLVNGAISNLRTSLELTDDPAEIEQILDAIRVLTASRFEILRKELEAVRSTLSPEEYEQALEGLNLAEQLALENIDTETFSAISAEARKQVDFINGTIENLRLSLQLTDDPAEAQQILDAIRILTASRFTVLRAELEKLKDTLDDDEYDQALKGLNLAEQVALDQIDTEKFGVISAEAQKQVDFINGGIENLRLSLQLSDDPTEQQQILDAIKILTANRFKILREELNAIRENLDPEDFDQALKGLNLAERLAIQNLDTEKFETLSAEAQDQVNLINGSIENLRLSLQLTDDPADRQAILDAIKILTAKRFDILIQELKDIRENFDDDEQFKQALTGLELGKTLALENIDTEKFAEISAEAQGQVDFINTDIENLRLAFELADDPTARQQILDAIKILTAARFQILREELENIRENLKPGEYEQALKGLNLAEQLAIRNIDSETFSEISAAAQAQVDFINGAIDNLRLSFELTDDPVVAQQILDAIKVLVGQRFDVLIQELHAIRENLSPEQFNQALRGFELGKQVALENIDTEKFSVISEAAQGQVNFINGGIENLRISLQLTDDPAQQQQILDAIKVLVSQRFQVLREELIAIRDDISPEDFKQALDGINLSEQLALDNLDTEKFDAISAAAQDQVNFINRDIENLRTAFELTDDPTERQQILDTIAILTKARFNILREELESIRASLDPADYEQALKGLNLGETLALENINTEKFGVISEAAQKQVDFVNGAISNLELSLQLTDEPAEAQQILDAIKVLVARRFSILIEELKAIEDTFDDPALFRQTLEGLKLGRDVALQGIDDRSIGITLEGFTGRISETDADIAALFDDLAEQTTASGINTAVDRLRTAITTKYDLIRERIEASADSEESQAEQIAAVNVQEAQDLRRLGEQGLGAFDSLINTAQFLLDNATEGQFSTRREDLITAINTFYDERIAFVNGLDLSNTDRANMLEVVSIQRNIALNAVPQMHQSVVERLELEKELQSDIADLRDQQVENEQDRLDALADLQERHNEKILELEEKLQEDILGLRRDRAERAADIETEFQRDVEDLRTRIARDLFGDDVISFADLSEDQQGQVEASTEYQRRLFDLEQERNRDRQDLNTEFGVLRPESTGAFEYYLQALQRGELSEQDILSVFGRRGLDQYTQFNQTTTDAGEDLTADTADVNAEAEAQATALTEALTPLLTQQKATADTAATTAEIESTTADTAATTAEIAATTADTAATTAEIESITVGILEKTLNDFAETLPVFKLGSADLKAGAAALQNIDPLISAIADIPRRISGLSRTLDSLPERLERALSESFSELNSLVETTVSVENLSDSGLLSALSGPEPDTRLFHFASTDNLARRIAKEETLRMKDRTPQYFASREQRQNADDFARAVMTGITEAQRAGGNTLGDKKIEITIQPADIVLKDEVVGRSIDETLVELDQDGRTIGSYQRKKND